MVIFTNFFYFKRSFLLLILVAGSLLSKAQYATDIYTDFGGFWHSSLSSFNPVLPDKSHNVVGFTYGGVVYSTGVNNSLLTTNGVAFTPGIYKTLPFTSIAGSIPASGGNIYVALAEKYDGITAGFSNPLPAIKVKDALIDGINGLNIGTGVTNLPSAANMLFPAQIISSSAIADNQPDIIYAQLTDAATSADVLLFQDSIGHTVGKSNPIQWNLVKSIGSQNVDFYSLTPGALLDTASITSGFSSNTTQNLRLATFKLSDFGITAANASQVKAFVLKPAGSSDPAFIAYNTEAIYIIPPIINVQPQTQVVCTGTGQSATFSVNASGLSLTYQWVKNGVNIPGATSSTYTIPVVTTSDVGSYQALVSNPGGTQYSDVAYLNTTINRQPSPLAQTIVTGNTITYSVSANNVTSFQWKKDGVNIPGAIDSIYTISPVNTTDNGSYTVSVINSASGGCATMLSNAAVLTPAIVVYSKSAPDINIPATWGASTDGSGSTPVDFTRAEHTFVLSNRPSGNTLTNLTIAGTLDVKNGVAIIADSTTLDVGHCIRTGTGSVSGSASAGFTLRGNSDLYFTSGLQLLKNFTITGGTVNMLSPLTISGGTLPGKLNLTSGTLALGGNKITIQSTSTTNTSMVTAVSPTASITYGNGGAFIIEKFIPAKRSFRFVSPAVTTTGSIRANWMEGVVNPDRWNNINPLPGYGTHITGPLVMTDSLDVTQTFNPSLYYFDKNIQTWYAVPNSNGTLTAGYPYRLMVRGSRAVDLNDNFATPSNTIIRTTGSLITGTYTVSPSLLSNVSGNYSFVGNPYASPVNWLTILRSGVSSSYYTWDEKLNTRGAYVAYNGLSLTNSSISSLVDENIQSQQSFLVQTTSSTPSIQFTEANKTGINTSVFRGSSAPTKLSVQLLLNTAGGINNVADGFVAVYDDNFSKVIGDQDSYKFTNLDENIAINRNGTLLSIEGRPHIRGNDTIPIKMWQFRQKDYWFKIDAKNFPPAISATLKDDYLKQQSAIDLSSSTVVSFVINGDSASFAPGRFSIIYGVNATLLPVTITNIKAAKKGKDIQVDWGTETEINIEKYEVEKSVTGLQFYTIGSVTAKSNTGVVNYNWIDNNATGGNNFYRIKSVEKTGNTLYSDVVRVHIDKAESGFTIYPNPVTGKELVIQLSNLKQGKYDVNMYNNAGQKVYSSSMDYNGVSGTKTISLKQKISKGKYSLQLTNENTSITQSLIMQ